MNSQTTIATIGMLMCILPWNSSHATPPTDFVKASRLSWEMDIRRNSTEVGQQAEVLLVEMEKRMKVVYKVTRSENGVEQMLGHLSFDDENNATLTLKSDSPAHEKLRQTWAEVEALDVLPIVRRIRRKLDDGTNVTEEVEMEIAKSDKNYPPAVVHYLGLNHGYFLAKDFDAMGPAKASK